MKEDKYKKHVENMFGLVPKENFSEEQVNSMLENLLQCIPNDGKLYKYRSIQGDAFDKAYDSLKNGYLWHAQTDSLNDDSEICINYNPEKLVEKIKEYILQNPMLIIKLSAKSNSDISNLDRELLLHAIKCIDINTGKINMGKALSYMLSIGCIQKDAYNYLSQVENYVQEILRNFKNRVEEVAANLLSINEKLRKSSYIYSMSENYDIDTMWSYYTDNKGFCIELDLSKIKALSLGVKRRSLSLYKIEYGNKAEYELDALIKCIVEEKTNSEEYKTLVNKLCVQTITKKEEWKYEKEWRFYLYNLTDSKVYVDLVSSVIIDSRSINTDNAQKLVELCKEREWIVKIRRTNNLDGSHMYENYQ